MNKQDLIQILQGFIDSHTESMNRLRAKNPMSMMAEWFEGHVIAYCHIQEIVKESNI